MLIKDITHANIERCEFELLKNKTKGRMIVEMNLTTVREGNSKIIKYSLPLSSIWVDTDSNKAIRAFCSVNLNQRNKLLISIINKFKNISIYSDVNVLYCYGDVVRYGIKPGLTSEIEDSDYVMYEVFESKSKMLYNIFDSIKVYKQVGGFDSCDLDRIPDRFFQIFGFIPINDYFNRMPPMWKARPSLILNPETDRSGYGQYGYSQSRSTVKKRGELFLEVIKAILNGTSVIDAIKKRKESGKANDGR